MALRPESSALHPLARKPEASDAATTCDQRTMNALDLTRWIVT
jgi:hypothetical protein